LAALHAQRPRLAAYCLARSLLLTQDDRLELDGRLMGAAWGRAPAGGGD
jgi:hypothetical protein